MEEKTGKTIGRRRVMERNFLERNSRPSDYIAITSRCYRDVKQCQLCGQRIDYAFLLEHKVDQSKSMKIGNDCVCTFVDVFLQPVPKLPLLKIVSPDGEEFGANNKILDKIAAEPGTEAIVQKIRNDGIECKPDELNEKLEGINSTISAVNQMINIHNQEVEESNSKIQEMKNMLDEMEVQMEKLKEEERVKDFAESNPNFRTEMQELNDGLRALTKKYTARQFEGHHSQNPGKWLLPIFEVLSSASSDMRLKHHTSDPKVKTIHSNLKELQNGNWEIRFQEHAAVRESQKTYTEDPDQDFYARLDKYGKLSGFGSRSLSETTPVFSKLEKEVFDVFKSDWIDGRERYKKKLKKELPKLLEGLKASFVDGVSFVPKEDARYEYMNDDMREKYKDYEYYVYPKSDERGNYITMSNVMKVLDKFEKTPFDNFFRNRISAERLIETLNLGDFGVPFSAYNAAILCKTESDAQRCFNAIVDYYNNEIEKFKNFVESDELFNEEYC